jgi:hypothetical protein
MALDAHQFDIQARMRADAAHRALEDAFKAGLMQASGYIGALLLEVQRLKRELAAQQADTPEALDAAMRALSEPAPLPYTETFTRKQLEGMLQLRVAIAADPTTHTVALRIEETPKSSGPDVMSSLILPPQVRQQLATEKSGVPQAVMNEAAERFAAGERAPAEGDSNGDA